MREKESERRRKEKKEDKEEVPAKVNVDIEGRSRIYAGAENRLDLPTVPLPKENGKVDSFAWFSITNLLVSKNKVLSFPTQRSFSLSLAR